jgi:hypothetical protein
VRGTGGAIRRELGAWAASWPRNPVTCASAHALVHGEREEGRSDREGPQHRESKGGRAGAMARRWRTGPAR